MDQIIILFLFFKFCENENVQKKEPKFFLNLNLISNPIFFIHILMKKYSLK
jgi:hypothetical protein